MFGADDPAHPAVWYLHNVAGPVYLGGPVTGLQQPIHYDFRARRDTPNELRAYFRKMGWRKIVAFQTRNPLHRAHQELTFRAAKEVQANLLIHPVVGMTKPGDVDHFTRVRCYEAVLDKYPAATTTMSLLPLAMLRLSRAPSTAEIQIISGLFLVGAATGFVYWLIAGRGAGGERADPA